MKKMIVNAVASILLGGCSVYLFFSLYGVAAWLSLNNSLYDWIIILPESFQKFGFLLHETFLEVFVSMIAMGFAGLIIGIITNNYIRYGAVGFLSALIVFFILNGDVFEWDSQTSLFLSSIIVLSNIVVFFSWLCFFVLFAFFGGRLYLRIRQTKV